MKSLIFLTLTFIIIPSLSAYASGNISYEARKTTASVKSPEPPRTKSEKRGMVIGMQITGGAALNQKRRQRQIRPQP